MTTKLRERVTHHLDLGVTEDSKSKLKFVHCVYPNKTKVFGPHAKTTKHPDTSLSVSLQEDVIWTSHDPFRIDLNPEKDAQALFFRPLPWFSVESPIDQLHRVHSGALDPSALPVVKGAANERIELKFTATLLESTKGKKKDGVEILDPHVIVEP